MTLTFCLFDDPIRLKVSIILPSPDECLFIVKLGQSAADLIGLFTAVVGVAMETVVIVAIGVLATIFLASFVALVVVCRHRHCHPHNLLHHFDSKSVIWRLSNHLSLHITSIRLSLLQKMF